MESVDIATSNEYEIYFSKAIDVQIDTSNPYILITSEPQDWNDFGFKSRCVFSVRDRNELYYGGVTYVGFLGDQQSAAKVITQNVSEQYISATKLPQFFGILGMMADYRKLVLELGVDRAKEILIALNDLVALRFYEKTPEWVEEAVRSSVFVLGLMREYGRFYAYHNAYSLLSGVEHETFSNVSSRMDLVFKLDGFNNEHRISFRFDQKSVLPKRINVLIGKNGLGKSQALSRIVSSLVQQTGELTSPGSGRPIINQLLAIGTPGETTNTFPKEKRKSAINYRRLMLRRNARLKGSRGVGELIQQLVRSDERIGSNDRWELFIKSVQDCLPLDNIQVQLAPNTISQASIESDNRKQSVPLGTLRRGGEQTRLEIWAGILPNADPLLYVGDKNVPLSSGQLAFLQFALQACLFIENGTLVLLDEPETHLHPNLVTNFIELLDNMLERTGSVAILATHSAYFVREVTSEQVIVFNGNEQGIISIDRPILKTFGANVGALSHFVFEDELENRLLKKIEKTLQGNEDITIDTIIEQFKNDLSSESIMLLKNHIQDS